MRCHRRCRRLRARLLSPQTSDCITSARSGISWIAATATRPAGRPASPTTTLGRALHGSHLKPVAVDARRQRFWRTWLYVGGQAPSPGAQLTAAGHAAAAAICGSWVCHALGLVVEARLTCPTTGLASGCHTRAAAASHAVVHAFQDPGDPPCDARTDTLVSSGGTQLAGRWRGGGWWWRHGHTPHKTGPHARQRRASTDCPRRCLARTPPRTDLLLAPPGSPHAARTNVFCPRSGWSNDADRQTYAAATDHAHAPTHQEG
jgi:hypothetical protein